MKLTWQCPQCGRLAKTHGDVTAKRCSCDPENVWMQLQPPAEKRQFLEREPIRIPEPEPQADKGKPKKQQEDRHQPDTESSPAEIEATPVESTADKAAEPSAIPAAEIKADDAPAETDAADDFGTGILTDS